MRKLRLVHCLLLGHVGSIPTPEELRSMRRALGLKAQAVPQTPTEGALERMATTEEATPVGDSKSQVAPTPAPVSASGLSACGVPSATLRIAQRHFQAVPFWFEPHESDERGGSGREDSVGWSSTIRAVYAASWGGGDGRVDGMDLLLALCAVPDDTIAGGGVGASRVDEDDVHDTGELLWF